MKPLNYFKLCAKNLLRDYKTEYSQSDSVYDYQPQFFDINKIMLDFDLDADDTFSLMTAQHIIAKMVGLKSWSELINLDDSELAKRKEILDTLDSKIIRKKTYSIDFSGCERLPNQGRRGDYLVKCKKTPELMEIAQMKPDSLFLSVQVSDKEQKLIDADTEHLYVNVIPEFKTIRVHVPGTDRMKGWHAVQVKNFE